MGSKTIRNIQKIFRATSGVIFGRKTAGAGRGEELTPSDVRTLLSVSTTAEVAAAYQPIGSYAASVHTHTTGQVTGLDAALAAKADLVGGLVPAAQLPSYVDDVVEGANLAAFPGTGETGKIYVALDTSRTYRWSGSAYVELTDSTAVWGSVSGTLSNQTDLQSALTARALAATQVIAGTGLSGGGTLAADRSLSVVYGTTSGTSCQGNDSRLSDARTPTSHTHTSAAITDFAEAVDDEVASLLVAGTNITITYNDVANTLTIAAAGGGGSPGGSSGQVQQNSGGSFGGSTIWINSNTVEVRNSTNAMSLDVFRTYTSGTNFEAFRILNVASTGTRIGSAIGSAGGTGGASRQLDFGRWNAAGAWTSLLAWDSNDWATFTTDVYTTAVSRILNTQIATVADGAGLVLASNGYMASANATAFTVRGGQGGNSGRTACIFSTFHGLTAVTSYFDWRVAAAGATSTTSIMRLLFDGSLSLTAKLTGVAGNSSRAPMCFPDGAAPTSPVDGDIWFVGDVMFRRIAGVTKSLTFT